jgi:hypothetical protein
MDFNGIYIETLNEKQAWQACVVIAMAYGQKWSMNSLVSLEATSALDWRAKLLEWMEWADVNGELWCEYESEWV